MKWLKNLKKIKNAGEPENTASSIPGLNMEAGLDVFSGDMELYTFILGSFAKNTPDIIEKIKNVTKENLPDYAINVHSIKSVCATIGAENLNERAKNLETAAKAGGWPEVLAENNRFVKDTENLVSDVKTWLKKQGITDYAQQS